MYPPKSQQSPTRFWILYWIAALLPAAPAVSATPACPLENHDTAVKANAGCLVVYNNKLLVVQAHNGKMSIPRGSREKGESAACTAFRETWEETSLLTLPAEAVYRWSNGFVMYRCELQSSADSFSIRRPLEIRRILWLNPNDFSRHQWRFPQQTGWLKHWLSEQKTGKGLSLE